MAKGLMTARNLIRRWVKANRDGARVTSICHVHPLVYVIGHAASGCLIVAVPWPNSEPNVREWDRQYPLNMVRQFDQSLKAGDWAMTAYVSTDMGGETYCVPIPYTPPRKRRTR